MKWPVLSIGVVLLFGVVFFALSYGAPARHTEIAGTSTIQNLPTPLITEGSGVVGNVRIKCADGATSWECQPQVRTIQAYQGASSVGLFKTSPQGAFRGELPAGQYELRVDTATSTHCASVGIVISDDSYVVTDISCNVDAQ